MTLNYNNEKLNEVKKKVKSNAKNGILGVGVIIIIIIAVAWFMLTGIKHIEDINGPDNYTLQQITDSNIINRDIGARGLDITTNNITNVTTYSSKKFTGVEEIYGENIWGNRFEITINHARVDSGNFKIVLLEDDRIVHEFKLNELTQTYVLKNPDGYISLRIAGESADFQFDYSLI